MAFQRLGSIADIPEGNLTEMIAGDRPLAGVAPARLAEVAAAHGGEAVLVARLVWDDRELRWIADWQIDWQGRSQRWQAAVS